MVEALIAVHATTYYLRSQVDTAQHLVAINPWRVRKRQPQRLTYLERNIELLGSYNTYNRTSVYIIIQVL